MPAVRNLAEVARPILDRKQLENFPNLIIKVLVSLLITSMPKLVKCWPFLFVSYFSIYLQDCMHFLYLFDKADYCGMV